LRSGIQKRLASQFCRKSPKKNALKKKKKGLLARLSYGPAFAHVIEKLVPSEDGANDGKALVTPLLVTIVIR
jgi:hypothetical protein